MTLDTATSDVRGSAAPRSAPHVSGDSDVIVMDHVTRWYARTCAVNDVSFAVPRGSVFGYIGPNGAGKTTSMRILATLEVPHSGDARIGGLSSVNDPEKVRRQLGFMPDAFGTYSGTDCGEYLDFYARSHGLVGRERTRRLREVMDFTGLRPIADKPIAGLSKGMRQRLCLGRALIHDPAVLILDEPAAGLDPRARIELRRMIRALAAESKTILISSHILTELAETCDRVGIIERGQLLACGSVEEIRGAAVRRMRLVVREDAHRVGTLIQQDDSVSGVQIDGNLVSWSDAGDDAARAGRLRTLVNSGIDVLEFRSEESSLEDVFLNITQGHVQ